MHQYSPVEIPEYLTSEHQYKTSIKCSFFISDAMEQPIICFFFFHLVVGASKRLSHKCPARKHLQQPKSKMSMVSFLPPAVNCSQLVFYPQLCDVCWLVFSHFGPTGRLPEMQTKIKAAQELAFRMKLCSQNQFSGRPRGVHITQPLASSWELTVSIHVHTAWLIQPWHVTWPFQDFQGGHLYPSHLNSCNR